MKKISCPLCGEESTYSLKENILGGKKMISDECGHAITVFKYEGILSGEVPNINQSNSQNVTITDIKMSFGSMVEFMVKWVIASIPALIILFIIWMMVMSVFGVGIATLFK